nr:AtzG-like protein [Acetobacter senegalensis]
MSDLRVLARQIDLTIPADCMAGVAANTQLLRGYVDLICGMALPDTCIPAYEYRP